MKSFNVLLNTIDKVKKFVSIMNNIKGDAVLCSGKYLVNAKSIMGIFSLDLSKPITLEIENWKDEYGLMLEKYLV